MTASLTTVAYIGATILFILSLGGLSNPETARRGNLFGMLGMAIAVLTTIALIVKLKSEATASADFGYGLLALGVVVGGGIGTLLAKRVEMTKMPELVAAMHSLIGLAAVCIAVAAVSEPWAFGIAALLIIIISPILFTRLCGIITPFAEPNTLFKNEFFVALTLHPNILVFCMIASSTSPK